MRLHWLGLLVVCACDGDKVTVHPVPTDAVTGCTYSEQCNPLTQTGCSVGQKCTWSVDSWTQGYGHVTCVPSGTVPIGGACTYITWPVVNGCYIGDADNCVKGAVCTPLAKDGSGICKAICDNAGGHPMCAANEACVTVPKLFSTGTSSPAAAGVCVPACDPLADNDFDGSGSALSRSGNACGSATNGCYGIPSQGTPPRTQFTCMPDEHYATPLRHRSECTSATGCAAGDGTVDINSCNQGYEPLFYERTGVTTIICVALCAPLDCYAGNCGSNNANRIGAAPHRCANPDALGTFGSGEECEYLWASELDGSATWLPSPYSDSVGICFDHDAYGLPRCEDLPLHGSGSALDAVALGCVSSALRR